MADKTQLAFEETVYKLLSAKSRNSAKGKPMQKWFKDVFNITVSVARIAEDKQLGNRINEQFAHKNSVVVFVMAPAVNRESFVKKVRERQYPGLSAVLILGATGPNTPYTYEYFLINVENAFTTWVCQTFHVEPESLGSISVGVGVGEDLLQRIVYGAPGTGKSHKVDGLANDPDVASCVRTTFHPDSDYSTFVGAYKPVMNGEKIAYEFRPQAFMKAYVRAWQEMVNQENEKVKNVVLVIEEINRGNCAQIFGDLFQLLDRGNGGYSTYPIEADTDLATWLAKDDQLGNKLAALSKPEDIKRLDDWSDILSGKKLALPPNLYIWATMNTSDQSLFPIDSAFKRRWDWEYVPITKPDKSDDSNWKERKIEVGDFLFDWWEFLVAINGHIAKATASEDKQLGYFFVKADDATGYISADTFANKVLFYLYGDVFKSYSLPEDDCFKVNGEMLRFRDFFSDEPIKENEKKSRVKLDRLEAFLSGLKWDGKGVTKANKSTVAPSAPEEESSGDGSVEAPKEA